MRFYIIILAVLLTAPVLCYCQDVKSGTDKDEAYTRTIYGRAEKIVMKLGITDSSKATRVKKIIATQYRDLNDIHAYRDAQIKTAKQGTDKAIVASEVKKLEDEANTKITALHTKFLGSLSKELSAKQVDQVKDGLTYDVVHVTYTAYLEEIPTLTSAQKEQIMAWLVEAREFAMDAETSEKKHAWFGKYKGRINNYLSAAGYDLKKEGEEWEKRRNAGKGTASTKAE